MTNNINPEKFDAIIIGTGQAGKPLALALGDNGLKTAIIESKYVGGTCINYGCTPTKTMIASARAAYISRNAGRYGVKTGNVKVNISEVVQRKNEIVKSFRDSGRKRLQKHEKIDLIFGEASFKSEYVINVKLKKGGTRTLTSERIFINTGASPFIPHIEGLDKSGYLNSTTIMDIEEIPRHLVILGGGYIGLEFGQMFRRFGSKVTIIQKNSRLAPREDPDISEEIRKIFEEEGINVLLKADTKSIVKNKKGKLILNVKSASGIQEMEGTRLLVAAGLVPNTPKLNLDSAGIKTDLQGYVIVNDKLETNIEGIYSMGDVKGGPAFTHISYDDYRIIKGNLLENKNMSIKNRLVPYTIFIDPQLGRIGLTESEAKEKGLKFKTAKLSMQHVARAIETGETEGFMKAIIDSDTGQILGCAILGSEGGEVMSMIEIAMSAKVPYTVLRDGVFAHPLYAESLNSLFRVLSG
jgi:pyruvate/2-oxoglutarate dehydrogenase complex dihydrolipoamide dehydrogenase (E3) component